MPVLKTCLHCGSRVEIPSLAELHVNDERSNEPCLFCGLDGASHIRYYVDHLTRTFEKREASDVDGY